MSFRIDLEIYRGPLDLLLYLVRKHEIDIADIPISLVTEQYLEHLAILEKLDVDAVGDFLEMASTLIEIKSRLVLPQVEEAEEPLEDPRQELVERLLEYKKFRDAASMLEERSRSWQKRYARLSDDLPPRKLDPADQPLAEVELWDLVSALGRVMKYNAPALRSIVYDDTPIHVHMARIQTRLVDEGRVAFSEFFQSGMHKSGVVGVFLAILELVRHHRAKTEQTEAHGEIWVIAGEEVNQEIDLSKVDSFDATPNAEPLSSEEISTTEPSGSES